MGIVALTAASISAGAPDATWIWSIIGVSVIPGWMQLIRMWSFASSRAAPLAMPTTACFDVVYADVCGNADRPWIDEVITTEPRPRRLIGRIAARRPSHTARTLTDITWSKISSG